MAGNLPTLPLGEEHGYFQYLLPLPAGGLLAQTAQVFLINPIIVAQWDARLET